MKMKTNQKESFLATAMKRSHFKSTCIIENMNKLFLIRHT